MDLRLYWKDEQQVAFGSLGRLKKWLDKRGKNLVFAMNGEMYQPGQMPDPWPLYRKWQNGPSTCHTLQGTGNFYLQPNGVFYVTRDKTPHICPTPLFHRDSSVQFATQSGPLLVTDGKLHPVFQQSSANLNIRNGVGILPDGAVLFAMSAVPSKLPRIRHFFQRHGMH